MEGVPGANGRHVPSRESSSASFGRPPWPWRRGINSPSAARVSQLPAVPGFKNATDRAQANRERAVGLHRERQPDVTRVGQVARIPAIRHEDETIGLARHRQHKSALRTERLAGSWFPCRDLRKVFFTAPECDPPWHNCTRSVLSPCRRDVMIKISAMPFERVPGLLRCSRTSIFAHVWFSTAGSSGPGETRRSTARHTSSSYPRRRKNTYARPPSSTNRSHAAEHAAHFLFVSRVGIQHGKIIRVGHRADCPEKRERPGRRIARGNARARIFVAALFEVHPHHKFFVRAL